MTKHRFFIAGLFLVTSGLVSTTALAGGHFDVDDAVMLDPGQCQYEVWATHASRSDVDASNTLHLGPACRVGPVELGFDADRSTGNAGHLRQWGPQIKWTFIGNSESILSAALTAEAQRDSTRHGRPGTQLVVPVTWLASGDLTLHGNIGADWAFVTGVRTARYGAAGEWAMSQQSVLIAEAIRANDALTRRLGLRVNLAPLISVDLSASRATGASGQPGHTIAIGLNHEFSR